MKISVAMATYNGERFLEQQILSILNQLNDDDELIISDNNSLDKTCDIINKYVQRDKRVKLYHCNEIGVICNFNNALKHCTGDIIFLSDQDDIWQPNKVNKVLNIFYKEKCDLLIHDVYFINEDSEMIHNHNLKSHFKPGVLKNIIKNSYMGCCMVFNKKILNKIFPIPINIPMHDQYIGIMAKLNGKVYFCNDKLIKYRRHSNNVSQKQNRITQIKNRYLIVKSLLRGINR